MFAGWKSRPRQGLLCIVLLLLVSAGVVYLDRWTWKLLAVNAQTSITVFSDCKLLTRPGEEPIFKVWKNVTKQGSELVINFDIRGKFSETEESRYIETEVKACQRASSGTRAENAARQALLKDVASKHASILASRMIRLDDPSSWSLSEPTQTSDFELMSNPELTNFKEQLLKTVVISLKVRTIMDPWCQKDDHLLLKTAQQGKLNDWKFNHPTPTVNGTYLLLKESIVVTPNTQCQDVQWSKISQVLRASILPDNSPYWFKSFRAPDETMYPENRCHLDNTLINGTNSEGLPTLVISSLFCF